MARTSLAFMTLPSLGDALDEPGAHRQLGGSEPQRLARGLLVDAVDLEHDPARLHPAGPVFRRALALAHTDLGRLGRHRHVREYPDPHPAGPLHVAGDRPAGRFDLARGHALRIDRLQAETAEIEVRP